MPGDLIRSQFRGARDVLSGIFDGKLLLAVLLHTESLRLFAANSHATVNGVESRWACRNGVYGWIAEEGSRVLAVVESCAVFGFLISICRPTGAASLLKVLMLSALTRASFSGGTHEHGGSINSESALLSFSPRKLNSDAS